MTLAPTRLETLRNALTLHPAVESVDIEAMAGTLRVQARSATRSWNLRLRPERLSGWPEFYLLDEPLVGRLAHVNHDGIVCVTDKVGLSLDPVNSGDVISAALTGALAQLDKSVAAEQEGDFDALLDEFEGYWLSVPRCRAVDVHFAGDTNLRPITAVLNTTRRSVAFLERRHDKHPVYAGLRRYQGLPQSPALYIPLTKAVLPPMPQQPLTVDMVRKWVQDGLDRTSRELLEKQLKSWPKVSNAYLLLSQPRPSGGRALFGVQFDTRRNSKHPLLAEGGGWSVQPLLAVRHTAEYLRPRGGASPALATKRIAVIGCGAVGARIAEHLALSGVGALTLVDPEAFAPDNLFRHVLGAEACATNKAKALGASLVRRLPDIKVDMEPMTLEEWAATRENLMAVDGVVLAIGVPHKERAFVRAAREIPGFEAPIVTTWLEPLGLGGHAQLSKRGRAGCLECLYSREDGSAGQVPKIAHVEADQVLGRNLTGCVGSFTSFSAIDATQTALMASRMIVTALTRAEGPTYAAWKGSDRECLAAGIRTTPWYQHLDERAIADAATEYSRVKCAVCGGTA